ncbi:MAG TPA: hypothetical protein VND91_00085 [Candidatus Saccharimonadia bacterium]|nr:hypothetical protein [Candidatus Saccharimonadia bacterium]
MLLAFSATAVQAGPKGAAAPATGAATGQPSTPLDLWVRSAATKPAAPLDLTLPPAGATPAAPIGPAFPPAVAAPAAPLGPPVDPLQAAPAAVREVVSWITVSHDNARLPFLVIDKPTARVFAFNASGQFQGDAPVLLGMGPGDVMLAPNATMSQMPPHTRITPAGRFVSKLAKDAKGKELLVLDYKKAFSLHPVVKGKPHERRADRLASVTAQDNRISFGCINVPVPFYETVVSPAFTGTHGIVYILPETSQASAMFRFNPVGVGALASGPQQVTPAGPQQVSPAGPQQVTPVGPQQVRTALNGTAGQTVPEAAAK